jgi:hypothetical protein
MKAVAWAFPSSHFAEVWKERSGAHLSLHLFRILIFPETHYNIRGKNVAFKFLLPSTLSA